MKNSTNDSRDCDEKLQSLRAAIQIGADELARGEGIEFDDAGLDNLCDAIANGYEERQRKFLSLITTHVQRQVNDD